MEISGDVFFIFCHGMRAPSQFFMQREFGRTAWRSEPETERILSACVHLSRAGRLHPRMREAWPKGREKGNTAAFAVCRVTGQLGGSGLFVPAEPFHYSLSSARHKCRKTASFLFVKIIGTEYPFFDCKTGMGGMAR